MSLARVSLGLRVRPIVPVVAARRYNSTSSTTASSTAENEAPHYYTSPRNLPMTWSEYLAMRKKRRLWSAVASVPTSIGGLLGGAMYFASRETDPTQLIFGLDPLYV